MFFRFGLQKAEFPSTPRTVATPPVFNDPHPPSGTPASGITEGRTFVKREERTRPGPEAPRQSSEAQQKKGSFEGQGPVVDLREQRHEIQRLRKIYQERWSHALERFFIVELKRSRDDLEKYVKARDEHGDMRAEALRVRLSKPDDDPDADREWQEYTASLRRQYDSRMEALLGKDGYAVLRDRVVKMNQEIANDHPDLGQFLSISY